MTQEPRMDSVVQADKDCAAALAEFRDWETYHDFVPSIALAKAEIIARHRQAALATALAEREGERAEIARLRAERDALLEVDRLAEIASSWHWWNATKCGDYEDKDDLFQDLDFARAKARDLSEARATLSDSQQ